MPYEVPKGPSTGLPGPSPKTNPNSAAGCGDAIYSNSFETNNLSALSGQNVYTPNAAQFYVYNNTNTIFRFRGIPFQPQGTACFQELIDGCYNTGIEYSFDNDAHTGSVIITKIIKTRQR